MPPHESTPPPKIHVAVGDVDGILVLLVVFIHILQPYGHETLAELINSLGFQLVDRLVHLLGGAADDDIGAEFSALHAGHKSECLQVRHDIRNENGGDPQFLGDLGLGLGGEVGGVSDILRQHRIQMACRVSRGAGAAIMSHTAKANGVDPQCSFISFHIHTLLDGFSCIKQMPFHRPHGNVQCLGNLLDSLPAVVVGYDDPSLGLTEVGDLSPQEPEAVLMGGALCPFGILCIDQRGRHPRPLSCDLLHHLVHRYAAALPHLVLFFDPTGKDKGGNAPDIGIDVVDHPVAEQGQVDLVGDIRGQLLGLVGISGLGQGKAVDPLEIFGDDAIGVLLVHDGSFRGVGWFHPYKWRGREKGWWF